MYKIICLLSFLNSDCEASAFYVILYNTYRFRLSTHLLSIHKHVYVCKRLIEKKHKGTFALLEYSLNGTKLHYVDHL